MIASAGCTLAPAPVVLDEDGVVETAASQWQHLNIEDGSVIYMDARTRLKMDLDSEHRVILLYTGQAAFEVVNDHHRPFIVRTG